MDTPRLSAKIISLAYGPTKFLGTDSKGKEVLSAFKKDSVREVNVKKVGIVGDKQGNTNNDPDRALCHYAAQNYALLSSQFGSLDTFKGN